MKKVLLSIGCVVSLMACSNTETDPESQIIETVAPATYSFKRAGATSVSFGGQTTRIEMGGEFVSALKNTSETNASLNAKFAHTAGANNFSDADLNASSKSVRSKVAAATDFYASNTTDATAIKADFDSWISAQVSEVCTMWVMAASAGNAGQIQ
jgi:hypothetical protein